MWKCRLRQTSQTAWSIYWTNQTIKCFSTSPALTAKAGVLGIRRETINPWERRAPLAPHHVRKLVRNGVQVFVQPSNRRAYPQEMYADAGAIMQEDLSECPVIMGVKSVPIEMLMPNKTYAFFSHTIKAQEANMQLLDAILAENIRLIDYEKMVNDKGQRVVAFGKYAGVAGMIDILHGLGLRLLALGHHTPFLHIGLAHNYRSSAMARAAIRDAGYEISLGLMPKSIGPLTFIFTGTGNVSQGAQEMFQELPYEYVEPRNLPKVAQHGSRKKLYACVVSREDHLIRKEGGPFNSDEFEAHPDMYYSNFSRTIAPHASVIINGIYYAPNAPRLLYIPDAKNLLQPSRQPWLPTSMGTPHLPHRLLAICDISADPVGSIEFMNECTTIEKPFCLYDADENKSTENFSGPGVLVCSIDNMPTQLPREATDFFGDLLLPHVYEIVKSNAEMPFEDYTTTPVVKNAVITSNGKLAPNFEYIARLREINRTRPSSSSDSFGHRILILGAGYVSEPVVEYLSRNPDFEITVASDLKNEVHKLSQRFGNVEPQVVDVIQDREVLDDLIRDHELVISLLPYSLHPRIAKSCIKHKSHMVTTSYVSDELRALNDAAKDAGITIVNEVGLDPGIDHLLAMQCFQDIENNGGRVKSFVSYCGGLPAPEFSDNPLRYKFSWSPWGVLRNALSGARYLRNGEVMDIGPNGKVLHYVEDMDFLPGFNLEGIPNRDSTVYAKAYGIESAHTILRGTLRYKGYCEALQGLITLGLIDENPHPSLHPDGPEITWKKLMCTLLNKSSDILLEKLKDNIYEKLDSSLFQFNAINRLGLLSDVVVSKRDTPLATLSHYLAQQLAYAPGERDIVILRHDVEYERPDRELERRHIDLVVYGEPNGYSAMAKTVGYPCAIAAKMVMEDEIQYKGIFTPLFPEIYRPMLTRLKYEGIKAVDSTSTPEEVQ